jgi:hypothetical protein
VSASCGFEPCVALGLNLVKYNLPGGPETGVHYKDSGTKTKTGQILRQGACYVRSRHKLGTSEIPSEEEMRELLELAIDKGVMRFLARAEKAGLYRSIQSPPASPSEEELFRKQIEDMK